MKKSFKFIIKRIYKFLLDSVKFLFYLFELLKRGNFNNNKLNCKGNVIVLANGPSLKDDLNLLIEGDKFNNSDCIVMNYFAFDQSFFYIKPKHYCLVDPMFFTGRYRKDEVFKLYDLLENQVNWDINIYIPTFVYKMFLNFSGLRNHHLKIVRMNMIEYSGYENLRNYFYKKGLAMPIVGNVANFAVFVALFQGYSNVLLYGVDHNFFDALHVNENNQLCKVDKHFYDSEPPSITPVINEFGNIYRISDFLVSITNMFKGHDMLAEYSKALKVNIINCTKNSLIDSYERLNKK